MDRALPLVIVNPASRGGAGARDWPSAASALARHFGPFDRRFTTGPGDAIRLAREEVERGRQLLLTFGGDGTISETARGILDSGSNCELAVLPHGTGGDFIRSLGLARRLADAARQLRDGKTVAIDVGCATFADGTTRNFVNSASFGLSAEVAHRVNTSNKSRSSYARNTMRAALAFDFPEVRLRVFGARIARREQERRVRITTVSVHNGRFFGGGMKMAPAADLTDGELEWILVKKMKPLALLRQAPLMYWGAHLGVREVEHGSVASMEAAPIHPDDDIRVEVDGESVGRLPVRFHVRPRALRLRVPKP